MESKKPLEETLEKTLEETLVREKLESKYSGIFLNIEKLNSDLENWDKDWDICWKRDRETEGDVEIHVVPMREKKDRIKKPFLYCKKEGCISLARYNFPDKEKSAMCKNHKLKGMVYMDRKCEVKGCPKMASFSFPDQIAKLRCGDHKLDCMVNHSYESHKKIISKKKNSELNLENDHKRRKIS